VARIDKQQAILAGAFTVFARKGYAQACMQEIADEAGVAKPTMYKYVSDKATLFQDAMRAAARKTLDERLAMLEPLTEPGDDIRATLVNVGYELLRSHCDGSSCALRRLLYSEINTVPELLAIVSESGSHRLNHALADRFARLMLAGHLRTGDPAAAAEQFMALLTGPIEARSHMGTRRLEETELRDMAKAAAQAFLRD
jgi:TetR/AcrR family transcriptional repressor of mexJK operon